MVACICHGQMSFASGSARGPGEKHPRDEAAESASKRRKSAAAAASSAAAAADDDGGDADELQGVAATAAAVAPASGSDGLLLALPPVVSSAFDNVLAVTSRAEKARQVNADDQQYQWLRTVDLWVELREGEFMRPEGFEDRDKLNADGSLEVHQDKHGATLTITTLESTFVSYLNKFGEHAPPVKLVIHSPLAKPPPSIAPWACRQAGYEEKARKCLEGVASVKVAIDQASAAAVQKLIANVEWIFHADSCAQLRKSLAGKLECKFLSDEPAEMREQLAMLLVHVLVAKVTQCASKEARRDGRDKLTAAFLHEVVKLVRDIPARERMHRVQASIEALARQQSDDMSAEALRQLGSQLRTEFACMLDGVHHTIREHGKQSAAQHERTHALLFEALPRSMAAAAAAPATPVQHFNNHGTVHGLMQGTFQGAITNHITHHHAPRAPARSSRGAAVEEAAGLRAAGPLSEEQQRRNFQSGSYDFEGLAGAVPLAPIVDRTRHPGSYRVGGHHAGDTWSDARIYFSSGVSHSHLRSVAVNQYILSHPTPDGGFYCYEGDFYSTQFTDAQRQRLLEYNVDPTGHVKNGQHRRDALGGL